MRQFIALSAIAASLAAAACTPAEEQTALAGITTACTVAAIGSSVVVDVAVPGSSGSKIGTIIGTEGAKACPAIVAGAQTLISQATAAGQTAMATVTVTSPTGNVALRRRVAITRRTAAPDGSAVSYSYTVMPGGFGGNSFAGVPVLGDL